MRTLSRVRLGRVIGRVAIGHLPLTAATSSEGTRKFGRSEHAADLGPVVAEKCANQLLAVFDIRNRESIEFSARRTQGNLIPSQFDPLLFPAVEIFKAADTYRYETASKSVSICESPRSRPDGSGIERQVGVRRHKVDPPRDSYALIASRSTLLQACRFLPLGQSEQLPRTIARLLVRIVIRNYPESRALEPSAQPNSISVEPCSVPRHAVACRARRRSCRQAKRSLRKPDPRPSRNFRSPAPIPPTRQARECPRRAAL